MDARRLLIFGSVVRAGSLAAAARELGWTQPAVSQHVRALERELRLPLVVRGARGITVTEAGRALLAHADAVAARLHAAEAELAALTDARSGTVRLAAFPTAGATLVPAALAVLARDHPGIEVRLTDAEPPEALDLLAAGEVDAAIVFRHDDEPVATPSPSGSLVEHRLGEEPLRLVLPVGHPLAARPTGDGRAAGRRPLRLADAAGERWVGGCVRCREHLIRACAVAGFVPDIRHSTDDYLIVQSLVAAGLAVALLPQAALEVVTRPGIEVRDVTGAGRRVVSLAHHPDTAGLPALKALLAALPPADRDGPTTGRSSPSA